MHQLVALNARTSRLTQILGFSSFRFFFLEHLCVCVYKYRTVCFSLFLTSSGIQQVSDSMKISCNLYSAGLKPRARGPLVLCRLSARTNGVIVCVCREREREINLNRHHTLKVFPNGLCRRRRRRCRRQVYVVMMCAGEGAPLANWCLPV